MQEYPEENSQITRSQVAPVNAAPFSAPAPGAAGNAPESTSDLPKDLDKWITTPALANAGALEKLSPVQRRALTKLLDAARSAHKEVKVANVELTTVKGRLRIAEKDLLTEAEARRRHVADAAVQVADLTKELVDAAETACSFESRSHARATGLWWAFGLAFSALMVCASLLAHSVAREIGGSTPSIAESAPHRRESVPANPVPGAPDGTASDPGATEVAFEGMVQTLAQVPLNEMRNVLHGANQWLKASGVPPCTVGDDSGVSLLVTPTAKGAAPLATLLRRCAQAIEHVQKTP
jgi:hypothetical protein